MILLNDPWPAHERRLAIERRHEAAARFLYWLIWCSSMLALGIGLGAILTHCP